jgi:hypothetical protein
MHARTCKKYIPDYTLPVSVSESRLAYSTIAALLTAPLEMHARTCKKYIPDYTLPVSVSDNRAKQTAQVLKRWYPYTVQQQQQSL